MFISVRVNGKKIRLPPEQVNLSTPSLPRRNRLVSLKEEQHSKYAQLGGTSKAAIDCPLLSQKKLLHVPFSYPRGTLVYCMNSLYPAVPMQAGLLGSSVPLLCPSKGC